MAQQYFLVKSEPETYSWEHFETERRAVWDGVRNFEARNNLRAMRKGDLVLFYHSGDGKEIVGIATCTKEAYADPTAPGEDWSVVELVPKKRLKRSVKLSDMKADPKLEEFALVRRPRLSVLSVSRAEFEHILKLAQTSL